MVGYSDNEILYSYQNILTKVKWNKEEYMMKKHVSERRNQYASYTRFRNMQSNTKYCSVTYIHVLKSIKHA